MQSKLAMPGGAHAYRGIAVVRVRPRATGPRAGSEFVSGDHAADEVVAESSAIWDVVSASLPVSAVGIEDVTSEVERTVSLTAEDTTTCERSQNTVDAALSSAKSGFDPRPLGSTLISGPMVAARHKAMDSAAATQDDESVPAIATDASKSDMVLVSDVQNPPTSELPSTPPATTFSTPEVIAVTAAPVPPASEPTITPPITPRLAPSPPPTPVQSTAFSPLQVSPVSDTFTTGADPPPGNSRDGFVTGHPNSVSKGAPRPYLASGPPTDAGGYPAFRFDDAAASQYSSYAQSMPVRPNYEPRYPLSRSSNCDAPPPPMADPLNSSQSVAMPQAPADGYGYQRVPQDAGPVYGYNRAAGPQQQGPPQRPYMYRLPPPDHGPAGGPLPLAPPGPRGQPPQPYGLGPGPNPSDPWDIFEPGSTIGSTQGLLHIDGGVYGNYGPGPGSGNGYASPGGGYSAPAPTYGYGGGGPGGGGYNQPPPPPSYQYGGGGGGGAYGQQQQYYGSPPPGQYGGGAPPPPPPPPPNAGYRGAPAQPADAGQYYGGYPAPAAPRRAAPSTDQNYTYKARAPAGNMPEENVGSYSYGNSYGGGGGFGSGGNYGGQTSYGSPMPGNYGPGAQQEDSTSYPGIELLSPGYPEYERHARQAGGGGSGGRGSSQPSPQELRYPGMDGGSAGAQQQRALAPSGISEYSDRYTPPAYGSSYSNFTAPSAYGMPPPDAYGPYQQQGGYGHALPPPPPPGPEVQYGHRGYPGTGPAYPGAYPQRPMGMRTPEHEQAVPISAGQPRVLIADDSGPDVMIDTILPFAALPDACNAAMLAAAGAPGPAASLHLGVLAAALCCCIAAGNGVRAPGRRAGKEG